MKKSKGENKILSVSFYGLSKENLLKMLQCRIEKDKQTAIFTPNPQMLLEASKSSELSRLLGYSDINIPDGTGILVAARLLNIPVKERICGIDFGYSLLQMAAEKGYSVFFLGGRQGIASRAAKRLCTQIHGLNVCGTHHGYFQKNGEENRAVLKKIISARPDIVFVCMGFPMQEEWINTNLKNLRGVKLAVGLGGSLDVWSGNVSRAPKIMRRCGIEWLWRTACQPSRAKIFVQIPTFLAAVLKQKYK